MVGLLAILHLLAQSPESFDIDRDQLPIYAYEPSHQVQEVTAELEVNWNELAPKIRTAEQFRQAKDRAVPVIWFEGNLYFLNPEGKYVDSLTPPQPTPTPRPFGDVEFANGTQEGIQILIRPVARPQAVQSVALLAFESKRVTLPLGLWQYVVTGVRPRQGYASRGEFSAESYGVTHVLYGYPGRSVERAKNWIHREGETKVELSPDSPEGEEVPHFPERKINEILLEIPQYPNALGLDLPPALPNYRLFRTFDSKAEVFSFYEHALTEQGWETFERQENLLSFLKIDRKVSLEVLPAPPGSVSRNVLMKVYPLE